MKIQIGDLMNESGVRFGTSGARGEVSAMTDRVCYAYTRGFLQMLQIRGDVREPLRVAIAGDRRSSTPRIMSSVARAAFDLGFEVTNGGLVPSPAIALYGIRKSIPTVMVTGSHIPDDRNGIKFNKPSGEILKADETDILAQRVEIPALFDEYGSLLNSQEADLPTANSEISEGYTRRFIDVVKFNALQGKKVVVFGHSAVGRDILVDVYTALGAKVIRANWSNQFIPVDTEAIRAEDVLAALELTRKHEPFAIVSTDGDSDRPLISDETGRWLRGDVIGVVAAQWLRADAVVTPVSSSTIVERVAAFQTVRRTKIGSPFVIEGMQGAVAQGFQRVVGYEANGGFLTATDIDLPGGSTLPSLPTRDPIIVQLGVLLSAIDAGCSLSELMAQLPTRYTASNRLEDFPTLVSQERLAELARGGTVAVDTMLSDLIGQIIHLDTTDGLRMTGRSGEIVHLRGSGNAPELRCYAEADTSQRASELTEQTLARCASWKN